MTRQHRRLAIAIIVVGFASSPAEAQEASLFSGILVAPDDIGRDVNRAGGDTLIARWGTTPVAGGRLEITRGLAGVALEVAASGRRLGVRNEAGVDFPNHGESPVLSIAEGRVYPLGLWAGAARLSPYVSAGAGAALVSVDLDNVDDQELRALWVRALGAGVKAGLSDAVFLDVQIRRTWVSARGPIRAFRASAVLAGIGVRY